MKKTIITCSLFLTAFFIVLSCDNNVPEGDQTSTRAIATHMTPIDTVTKNIQHYVDSCYAVFGDDDNGIIRAYTVSDTDLLSVLGLPLSDDTIRGHYNQCRVYIGLDYQNKFKLYLTPIKDGKDEILKDDSGMEYLLDLNAPCPSTCGGMDSRLLPTARMPK
ncbi:MAG: hypothetical protein QE487_04975 [Fluviicola sp.]|nr:hypothetical protein [Fluviicola sp.]